MQYRRLRRRRLDPWVRKIPWRRAWQPTAVFLPGESHGQRSLVGHSPWGHKELDTTEMHAHTYTYSKFNSGIQFPSFIFSSHLFSFLLSLFHTSLLLVKHLKTVFNAPMENESFPWAIFLVIWRLFQCLKSYLFCPLLS